jgi:hypothetical protein
MEKLWGKYRAIVLSVADEEQRGRLLVQCPKVLGDAELGWADPCLPAGVFLLPNVGDFVYIEFEAGNIGNPIWVGIFATTNYIKNTFFPEIDYDPAIRAIVTPNHRIVLNDTEVKLIVQSAGDVLLGDGTATAAIARVGDAISATGTASDPQGGTIDLSVTGTITTGSEKVKSL